MTSMTIKDIIDTWCQIVQSSVYMINSSPSLNSKRKKSEPITLTGTLRARKRQFVRDEIWDAAIRLFAERGFDETTADDIAQAAGVSRRSFFRYYASKDDLMAQGIVSYGVALIDAINTCPQAYSPSEVLRETVLQVAGQAVAHPGTRTIIEIATKYESARQAQLSRMGEVQKQVAETYERRLGGRKRGDLRPEILAGLTLSLLDVALLSWFEGNGRDISAIVKQIFTNLSQLIGHGRSSSTRTPEGP